VMKPPRRHGTTGREREERCRRYPSTHQCLCPVLALLLFAASLSAQTFSDYPVPADILRFADTLHLTEEQIKDIEAISDGINANGQRLASPSLRRKKSSRNSCSWAKRREMKPAISPLPLSVSRARCWPSPALQISRQTMC